MTASAEWVQACSSCCFSIGGLEFISPNRDYPYEGLCVSQDGENWKFIDTIGLAIRSQGGRFLNLESVPTDSAVEINPWRVHYRYQTAHPDPADPFAKLGVEVSYRLHSAVDGIKRASGEVSISLYGVPDALRAQLTLILQPLIDIRHVFGAADFGSYQRCPTAGEEPRVGLQNRNRCLTLQASHGKIIWFDSRIILNWHYKLGTGQRQEGTMGNGVPITLFTSERKDVAAFFRVEAEAGADSSAITLYLNCSIEDWSASPSLAELQAISSQSLENDLTAAAEICNRFSSTLQPQVDSLANPELMSAILGRIAGATKFKVAVFYNSDSTALIPTAGAWWFKTPWFRDIFEGFRNNFRALMSLPEEKHNIGRVIWAALFARHSKTGLIPNRFPEHKGAEALYNSSDATLLCFITAARYCAETQDRDLARATLAAFAQVYKTFERPEPATDDGPPRIHKDTGLLLSTPNHSWTDTRSLIMNYAGQNLRGLPSRVSPNFVMDLCDFAVPVREVVACLSTPRFFLPEINAQWILVLRSITEDLWPLAQPECAGLCKEDIHKLLENAEDRFWDVFWNDAGGCFYNARFEEDRKENDLDPEDRKIADRIETEASVTAAAMLGTTIFRRYPERLNKIWAMAQSKLLVSRNLVRYGTERWPFGIIVKNTDWRIYYDDAQYHYDVVWPRSTPYLLQLLMLVNEPEIARKIILNNLDHQMSEGAIFYNHELFSKPSGNNPEQVEATCRNPVPVKNAVQFWSQWSGPILELFGA
jgi:hypothetical protein